MDGLSYKLTKSTTTFVGRLIQNGHFLGFQNVFIRHIGNFDSIGMPNDGGCKTSVLKSFLINIVDKFHRSIEQRKFYTHYYYCQNII